MKCCFTVLLALLISILYFSIIKINNLRNEINEEKRRYNHLAVSVDVRQQNKKQDACERIYGCIDDNLDFEGFDNVNGASKFIVPDIVHLLYLQETELKFFQVINIFSIYYNHKPGLIYIHCDNCSFHGKYWEWIKEEPGLFKLIKIHQIPYHETIFGKKYGWVNHHRSHVWRLQVLMNYGGIYLDNDVYVVRSLHKYRRYEMTINWPDRHGPIGVQVNIAHRNARFLRAHFDCYRYNYDASEWFWNAGILPAKILKQHEYLAHILTNELGTQKLFDELYLKNWNKWRDLDTIHLLINHRKYLDKDSPIKEFNEFNILNYNYTYGEMVREIMEKKKII